MRSVKSWVKGKIDAYRVIIGMFIATVIMGSVQIFSSSALFMIIAGLIHHNLISAVMPIGYWSSIILMACIQVLVIVLRITVDYRDAFNNKRTDQSAAH